MYPNFSITLNTPYVISGRGSERHPKQMVGPLVIACAI